MQKIPIPTENKRQIRYYFTDSRTVAVLHTGDGPAVLKEITEYQETLLAKARSSGYNFHASSTSVPSLL
jgi:hypothetical protein